MKNVKFGDVLYLYCDGITIKDLRRDFKTQSHKFKNRIFNGIWTFRRNHFTEGKLRNF
jgi:hypothetical protein